MSVDTFGGIYCVHLDPSISLGGAVAFVTVDLNRDGASADVGGCFSNGSNGVQVNLWDATNQSSASDAFQIMIPKLNDLGWGRVAAPACVPVYD